jgi:predicted Holliday junction resolvase-like endonuclease
MSALYLILFILAFIVCIKVLYQKIKRSKEQKLQKLVDFHNKYYNVLDPEQSEYLYWKIENLKAQIVLHKKIENLKAQIVKNKR